MMRRIRIMMRMTTEDDVILVVKLKMLFMTINSLMLRTLGAIATL